MIADRNYCDQDGNDDFREGWTAALDQQIETALGRNKVIRPIEMLDGETGAQYTTINERIKEEGWPYVNSLRGKIAVVITRTSENTERSINNEYLAQG